MQRLVVLFALAAVCSGSVVPALWAQPEHLPALVLDPHGRPLDTAPVQIARALHLQAKALEGHSVLTHAAPSVAHAPLVAHVAPAAVSHQSRVDVRSSPAVVAHSVYAAPVISEHSVWGAHALPAVSTHGHWLKKRSLGLWGHAIAPSAVSHQSRVDVISSPALHAVAAPVLSHAAPLVTHTPLVAHIAPAAVSHQSRVDVRSSPAVVAHSVYAAPIISEHSVWGAHAQGHWLKKRSLAHLTYAAPLYAPTAVSHQSRVDVHSAPLVSHAVAPLLSHAVVAAPVSYAVPAAVSHQSRVDVRTSPALVSHAAISSVPHLSYAGLLHSAPLVHAW